MIVDAHLHWQPDHPEDRFLDLVEQGVINAGWVLSCNGIIYEQGTDEQVIEVCKRYPDVLLPFGYLDVDEAGPERVDWLFEQGCVGLKAIWPGKAYDDPACFPYYERATELGMPILFHVGGSPYWGPGRVRIDPATRELSKYMMPITIDAVAKTFPELTIIMAHMGGGAHSVELAAYIAHGHPNVYMDLSAAPHDVVVRGFRTPGITKVLFGSDATKYDSCFETVRIWDSFFKYYQAREKECRVMLGDGQFKMYGCSDEPRRLVMGGNAERLMAQALAGQGRPGPAART